MAKERLGFEKLDSKILLSYNDPFFNNEWGFTRVGAGAGGEVGVLKEVVVATVY